jgi:DNA-binding GntR family transcriptional regulator
MPGVRDNSDITGMKIAAGATNGSYAELRPGEQLRLRLLTERHGCGTSPIREALNSLVSAGLVERFDKRGFFVAGTSPEEFQDILTNRCFLEEEALRRSMAAGGADWEERVLVAHHRITA